MSNLESLVVDSEKFVSKNVILVVIVIVLVIGICLLVRKNRKGKQDEGEMTLTYQPEVYEAQPFETQQPETQQPETQQPADIPIDPSILEIGRKRAMKLFDLLEGSQKYIKSFDENFELSGDGFMYSLMRMMVDGRKVWVIFYPNISCDIVVLVFDRKIPWNMVMDRKIITDEFYGDEGKLVGDKDDYPAYVWDGGNYYDPKFIAEDLTRALETDSSWSELLSQFQYEDDHDDGDDEE